MPKANPRATTSDTLPEPIRKAIQDLEERIERIKGDAEIVRHMEEAVGETATERAKGTSARVSTGYDFGQITGPCVILSDAESIQEVVALLRDLRKRGYRVKDYSDYPEIQARTYELKPRGTVRVVLRYGGAVCEFRKVGERTEPVYELQCGDSPVPGLPADLEASP